MVVTTADIRRAKLQSNRHHQQTNTQLFTGRMPFLLPNQQHHSTEWKHCQCQVHSPRNSLLTQQHRLFSCGIWQKNVSFYRSLYTTAISVLTSPDKHESSPLNGQNSARPMCVYAAAWSTVVDTITVDTITPTSEHCVQDNYKPRTDFQGSLPMSLEGWNKINFWVQFASHFRYQIWQTRG